MVLFGLPKPPPLEGVNFIFMRDSTIFYRSFYEAICELPDTNKLEVYDAVFKYSLDFQEPELKGLSKTIFTLIKPQLDANNKRYMNGKQPKNKLEISKTEAKQKQNESKVEANKNKNENKNDNHNENENEPLPPRENSITENGSSSEYKQSILKDCIPEFVAAIAPVYYTSGQIPKIDKYLIEKGCYTKMFSNDDSFMEKLQKYYPIEKPEQVRKMLIQFLSSQDLHCNDKGHWKGWADLKNNFFNWHSKIAQTPKRKGLMG